MSGLLVEKASDSEVRAALLLSASKRVPNVHFVSPAGATKSNIHAACICLNSVGVAAASTALMQQRLGVFRFGHDCFGVLLWFQRP